MSAAAIEQAEKGGVTLEGMLGFRGCGNNSNNKTTAAAATSCAAATASTDETLTRRLFAGYAHHPSHATKMYRTRHIVLAELFGLSFFDEKTLNQSSRIVFPCAQTGRI